MTQTTGPERLIADQGFDPHRIYTLRSFSAQRSVVAPAPAGKPSIARLADNALLVSYTRGYCLPDRPWSLEVVRSQDDGQTWSSPVTAVPSSLVPGDNYLIPLGQGNVLLCFMSLCRRDKAHPWQGPYLCESTDGGRTWSAPWLVDISEFCSGPYGVGDRGHIVMPDGRLFFFVGTYEDPPRPREYLMISHDRGRTFSEIRQVSDISADSSFVRCASGAIAAALRVNAEDFPYRGAHPEFASEGECGHFMAFCRSTDEAKTWSAPVPITGHHEIPGHLMQLHDGRLLLSFGVRHYPLGIQAILSEADGITWNTEDRVVLAWHGAQSRRPNGRIRHGIGHPFTTQCEDGRLFTVYYARANPFDPETFQIEGLSWDVP